MVMIMVMVRIVPTSQVVNTGSYTTIYKIYIKIYTDNSIANTQSFRDILSNGAVT